MRAKVTWPLVPGKKRFQAGMPAQKLYLSFRCAGPLVGCGHDKDSLRAVIAGIPGFACALAGLTHAVCHTAGGAFASRQAQCAIIVRFLPAAPGV